MITEGSRVTYAGDDPLIEVGSTGKVLAVSGTAAHVQWLSGPKHGSMDLVDQFEILPFRAEANLNSFEQSLEYVESPSISVRASYDEAGEDGVVAALDDSGHLAMMAAHVERAAAVLAADLRSDPTFIEVLGQLEPDEADTVVSRVATVLLSDHIREA